MRIMRLALLLGVLVLVFGPSADPGEPVGDVGSLTAAVLSQADVDGLPPASLTKDTAPQHVLSGVAVLAAAVSLLVGGGRGRASAPMRTDALASVWFRRSPRRGPPLLLV